MNKVILVGRLGQNPEQRATPGGTTVTNFSIATNETYKSQDGEYNDNTEWHRCVAFGKTAEYIGSFFTKGRLVYVDGRLRTRKWTDQSNVTHYSTEVIVETAMLLDRGPQAEDGVYAPPAKTSNNTNSKARVREQDAGSNEPVLPENEEELPF
jgi:single-strand DNA-binding protein